MKVDPGLPDTKALLSTTMLSLTQLMILSKLVHLVFCLFVCLFVLAAPHSTWDLRSLTRDRTLVPCIGSGEGALTTGPPGKSLVYLL